MENHHYQTNKPVFFLSALLSFSCFYNIIAVSHGQLLPIIGEGNDSIIVSPQIYIVHVLKPEHTAFAGLEDLATWHKSFLPTVTLDSGKPRMVYSYQKAISGFAAWLTSEEVEAMEGKDGFLYAHPDEPLTLETTHSPHFLGLRRNIGLWSSTIMGEGKIIGVMDSGINPTHVSFSGDGMPVPPITWSGSCDFNNTSTCNNKLIGAREFPSAPIRPKPNDTSGHGTHVASIAAATFVDGANSTGLANGTASGTAPRAYLAIYRVPYTSGYLAAVDQVILDKVDVLSISMSQRNNKFYENSLAIGTLTAIENGIFVSCAAGNYGPNPSTIRNDAPWILTVGASTTDRVFRVTLNFFRGIVFYGVTRDSPSSFPSWSYPVVYPGAHGTIANMTCNTMLSGVNQATVLCWRDPGVSPYVQADFVRNSGGAIMVLMDNNPMPVPGTSLVPLLSITMLATTHSDSLQIIRHANRRAIAKPSGTRNGVHPYPMVASFSSRGPSTVNNGVIKPDILGPGVDILGASTGSDTEFVFKSGTSMATPHLSGIAALLRISHPLWSPAMIRSAIMTSANPEDSLGRPITDQTGNTANFFATGAGHVDPQKADDPGLVYDIDPHDYIRYICGLQGYTAGQVDVVARRPVDCATLNTLSGEELNYPSFSVTTFGSTTKNVDRTVTNVGRANTKYNYRWEVVMPPDVSVTVSPNRLRFARVDQRMSFTVSFTASNPRTSRGRVFDGELKWISDSTMHVVRSPLSVTVM